MDLLLNETAFGLLTDQEKIDTIREVFTQTSQDDTADINNFFIIIMGIFIFFMQAGFALLEAGSVRVKNTTNILLKNFLDACFGAVFYWAIGWALAYGQGPNDNPFIGTGEFFLYGLQSYPSFFFQFVFSATSATIVSGSLAERTDFKAYMIYSCAISGFIYPIVSHWVWDSRGWLFNLGMVDYAGSAVVHTVGGSAALMGALFVGPRLGRFNSDGTVNDIPGHSTLLATLGAMILWTGFYAFNGGSELVILGSSNRVGKVITNTTLSGTFGALGAFIMTKLIDKKWSLLMSINGSLAGMVAICAGVAHVEPWAAAVIGIIASLVYLAWSKLLLKLQIDDPLDAVPVHLGCGVWGTFAAPIFTSNPDLGGIFYHGKFNLLGYNTAGITAIVAWTMVLSGIMFGLLKVSGLLRISEAAEKMGADSKKHKEPAYPYAYHDEETILSGKSMELKQNP